MDSTAQTTPPGNGGSLVDWVFNGIFEEIVSGSAPVGSRLPAERALTERYGVNRQVVREALRRLEQIRMVSAGQGAGTTVEDWQRTGTFELFGLLLARSAARGEPDLLLSRSLLEMRLEFSVSVARLCALNAELEVFDAIEAVIKGMTPHTDPVERARRGWEIWSLMVDGSDNLGYRLLFNSSWVEAAATVAIMNQYSTVGPADNVALHNMLTALRNRNADAVELAVRWMFRIEPTDDAVTAGLARNRTAGPISPPGSDRVGPD